MRSLFRVAVLSSVLASIEAAESRMNLPAQALAKHLAPTPPATKAEPGDLARLKDRMIVIIDALETSARTAGPPPESLITKAYDFREDVPGVEQLLTRNAVLSAWREANARGLFNEAGKYSGDITKGRGAGGECVFELVVPGDVYPPASNQLANLRLVPVESKRNPGSALSTREVSFHRELIGMIAEKGRSAELARFENPEPTNALGMTEKESVALWQKAMDEAGEAGKEKPNLRLQTGVNGTPSHMTAERWRTVTEVVNNSSPPTEITVDIYVIGNTWKKRDYYLMAKSSHVLKLRASESRSLELFTKAEGSYKNPSDDRDGLSKEERGKSKVRYRGIVVVAKHGKDVISFIGTDQRLTEFGNPASTDSPLGGLPAF